MAIGKNSRKSPARSSIRAPKFLDKSGGFYGRLDEPEATGEGVQAEARWNGEAGGGGVEAAGVTSLSPSVAHTSRTDEREEAEVFGLDEGMMEDDGETLLRRKPSRRSSRWRRSSRRKQKEGRDEEDAAGGERPSPGSEGPRDARARVDAKVMKEVEVGELKRTEEEDEKAGKGKEPALVHFPVREEADDQVLIRDKKRGREEGEGEEERRMRREQEEGMKVVKRNTVKNYRKALDRALRRGWEAFITNLYSVTLTPVTSSTPSSPSTKKSNQHTLALVEIH